jgi:hypothetical protein
MGAQAPDIGICRMVLALFAGPIECGLKASYGKNHAVVD